MKSEAVDSSPSGRHPRSTVISSEALNLCVFDVVTVKNSPEFYEAKQMKLEFRGFERRTLGLTNLRF